jgi:hypothetical protein
LSDVAEMCTIVVVVTWVVVMVNVADFVPPVMMIFEGTLATAGLSLVRGIGRPAGQAGY